MLDQDTRWLDIGFLASCPDPAVLITNRRVQTEVFLVSEEHAFLVMNFELIEKSSGALQSWLLFCDVVDNLCGNLAKRRETSSFLAVRQTDLGKQKAGTYHFEVSVVR